MKTKTLLLAGILLCTILNAQNAFQETFDLNADDEFLSVIETSDGGSLSGGYSTGTPYGGIVVKLNSLGLVQWSKTVGGTRISEVVELPTGEYYAAGENNVSSNTNFYLVKLDAGGNIMWARSYGKTFEPDQLYSLAATADGGCILSGNADSTAGSGFLPVGYVVKVDASGNPEWSKYVSGGNGEIFYVTKPVSSGGYLSCGYTGSFGSQVGTEAYAVRWDNNGNVLWTSVFGHNNRFDRIYDFTEKPNGGFWVTGNGLYTSTTNNLFMASLDNGGAVVWHSNYDMYEGSWRIMHLNDGNLAIAGYNIDLNLGIYNQSYLIKTDTSGAVLWARQYGDQGAVDDKIWSAQETLDGGFVLSGSTYGTGVQRTSWIIRADSAGNSGCRDSVLSVSRTNLTIASTSGGTVTSTSLSSTIVVVQFNASMSSQFFCGGPNNVSTNNLVSAITIYPQPAGDFLTAETGETNYSGYSVYNMQGQLVMSGTITSRKPVIDISALPSGIFTLQMVADETGECSFRKFVKE